jgi:hypothetical protein
MHRVRERCSKDRELVYVYLCTISKNVQLHNISYEECGKNAVYDKWQCKPASRNVA